MVFGIRMAISKGAFLFQSRKTNKRMAGVLQPGKKSAGYREWNAGSVHKKEQKLAFRILTILL